GHLDDQGRSYLLGLDVERLPPFSSLHAEYQCQIRAVVSQHWLVPENPTVREHHDRCVIAIAVLKNVLHVAAIVVVSVAEHMDISELGMDDVVQGQGNSLNLDTAIRKLFRDVAPAVLQRREQL